jgi:hypothetical protein
MMNIAEIVSGSLQIFPDSRMSFGYCRDIFGQTKKNSYYGWHTWLMMSIAEIWPKSALARAICGEN